MRRSISKQQRQLLWRTSFTSHTTLLRHLFPFFFHSFSMPVYRNSSERCCERKLIHTPRSRRRHRDVSKCIIHGVASFILSLRLHRIIFLCSLVDSEKISLSWKRLFSHSGEKINDDTMACSLINFRCESFVLQTFSNPRFYKKMFATDESCQYRLLTRYPFVSWKLNVALY